MLLLDTTAICTPTRTGTNSLESILIRCFGAKQLLPRHRVSPPDAPFVWRRVLVTRNPYRRLVSQWTFLERGSERFGHLKKKLNGRVSEPDRFERYLDLVLEYRNKRLMKGVDWTRNQSEIADLFHPEYVTRTPYLQQFLRWLVPGTEAVVPHLSPSSNAISSDLEQLYRPSALEKANLIVEADLRRFNFPRLRRRGGSLLWSLTRKSVDRELFRKGVVEFP